MTKFIGRLSNQSQPGERKVYNYIEKVFQDEPTTFCYYEPIVGGLYPDFIIVSPQFGVLILEVKDYSADKLLDINTTEEWLILSNEKPDRRPNPFMQLYKYWRAIRNRIDKNKSLKKNDKLIRQLLIFPFLSKNNNAVNQIQAVQQPNYSVLYKEDLTRVDLFQSCLQNLYPEDFKLSLREIQQIRSALIISSRLPTPTQPRIYDYFPSVSVLRVFDEDQEKIAYNLGDGHRLIFGVAGSGKTVLLVARADFLALKNPKWRILILCYNRLLAKYLLKLIHPQKYPNQIEIYNFHKWAQEKILSQGSPYNTMYNAKKQEAKKSDQLNNFFSEEVPEILNRLISETQYERYDAILIDETQDFDKKWLECVVKFLNPTTDSLLITCDGFQGIYARKRFYWKEVGIKAPGRVTKFRKTYRNPSLIGEMAYRFLSLDQNLEKLIETEEEFAFLETKEFARKGGTVEFRIFKTQEEEYNAIARTVLPYSKENQSILILFHRDLEKINFNHSLIDCLNQREIEWHSLKQVGLGKKGVYIGTLQGTKGLEADMVIIPSIESIYSKTNKRQLLYVGMTRAIDILILTGSGSNEFTTNLSRILDIRSYGSDFVKEIQDGNRCYFCREVKYNGEEKPLCYNCWRKLVDQEICFSCGNLLSLDYENELKDQDRPKFLLRNCSQCSHEPLDYCKLCGETIQTTEGKPLCNNCDKTLQVVWTSASEKYYSKEFI